MENEEKEHYKKMMKVMSWLLTDADPNYHGDRDVNLLLAPHFLKGHIERLKEIGADLWTLHERFIGFYKTYYAEEFDPIQENKDGE